MLRLGAACITVELLLLVQALTAARAAANAGAAASTPSRARALLAGATALALLVGTLALVAVERARTLDVYALVDNAARLALAIASLDDQLRILNESLQLALPAVVLLATIVVALDEATRARARGGPGLKRCLALAAVVVAGTILPTGYALAHYTALVNRTAAAVAGLDPEFKLTMLTAGFDEARAFLAHATIAAAALGAIVTAAMAALIVRRTSSSPSPLDRLPSWLVPTAAVVIAAGLVGAGLRVRRERATPWPAPSRNAVFNILLFERSPIPGPDATPFAPVLEVMSEGATVDGGRVGANDASDRQALDALVILRNNYLLMHPGESFPGELGVVCRQAVPARRLDDLLQRAAVLGYTRPSLLLFEPGAIDRPLLGHLPRALPTAVAMHVDDGAKGWLPVTSAGTCATFTTRALEARRHSPYVQLDLAWQPGARDFAPPSPSLHLDADDIIEQARNPR